MAGTLAPEPEGLNPARLSAELAALFPPGVCAAELAGDAPPALLTEPELKSISHCSEKRIRDFTAGRLCARRALEELGLVGFSLLPASDRQPAWPASVIGSITHTAGYSAAVAARRGALQGLGVDAETIAAVHAELWPRVLGAEELARLNALPAARRGTAAALAFAAKEAFYKSQYPLTGEWLEFEDIAIESQDWHLPRGGFRVRPRRALRLAAHTAAALVGCFRVHGEFVTCGVALGA